MKELQSDGVFHTLEAEHPEASDKPSRPNSAIISTHTVNFFFPAQTVQASMRTYSHLQHPTVTDCSPSSPPDGGACPEMTTPNEGTTVPHDLLPLPTPTTATTSTVAPPVPPPQDIPGLSASTASILQSITSRTNGESSDWDAAREKVLETMVTSRDMEMKEQQGEDTLAVIEASPGRGKGRGRGRARARGTGRPPGRPRKSPVADAVGGEGEEGVAPPVGARGGGRGRARGRPARGRGSRGGAMGVARGGKRKRRGDDSESDENMMDDDDDDDEAAEGADGAGGESDEGQSQPSPSLAALSTPALTTKSGRLIQAPNTFSPISRTPSSTRRGRGRGRSLPSHLHSHLPHSLHSPYTPTAGGSRGARVTCKTCTRTASSPANVLLACGVCHTAFHQFCHSPRVPNSSLGLSGVKGREWTCGGCERIKATRGTGAGISIEAKRAYLQSLSRDTLITLLLHASRTHNDIPLLDPPALPELVDKEAGGEAGVVPMSLTFPTAAGEGLSATLPAETSLAGSELLLDSSNVRTSSNFGLDGAADLDEAILHLWRDDVGGGMDRVMEGAAVVVT